MHRRILLAALGLSLASAATQAQRSQAQGAQLLELMRRSPAEAVAQAPDLKDVYRGPADVLVMDDFQHGASTTVYRFRREGVEVSAYQRSVDVPLVRCGDIVQLEGVRLGGTMAVSRAEVTGRGAAGAGCSSVGAQQVAVILATFPGVAPPPTSAGALERLLFDETAFSASSWYRAVSYGKLSLSGAVFGPYTLNRSYGCAETSEIQAAAIQAADRDIDFTKYQRYILIYPGTLGCTYGGMGTLGCVDLQSNEGRVRGSWVWLTYTANQAQLTDSVIHELGHNLGLGHSQHLRFPGAALEADDFRAVPVEYGDVTAVMGSGRFGDFAAAHKREMGWLEAESDVVMVEADGEFQLAPLGADSGVRAMRVRRRASADEWLWLEYRPHGQGIGWQTDTGTGSGFDGVLVRRETPSSGVQTQLLDMTPASLEQARTDGGAFSEARPELRPGSTWIDPHSDLRISVGEAGSDGIAVVIRYEDRCAVPALGQVTVSAEQQEFAIPVAASAECEWQATSGRTWLRATRNESEVMLRVSGVSDELNRRGVVSIGRHLVPVIQKGPRRDLQVLSVSPPGSALPVNASVPFLFYLRDENGAEDTQAVQLSVVPGEGAAAAPCYFRYSSVRKVIEVSQDGVEFRDSDLAGRGLSGSCGLEALIFRVSATDLIFRFSLVFAGAEGEALTISVRAEDVDGVAGAWVVATEMNTVSQCRALPTADYFVYLAGGGANQGLSVRTSDAQCVWSAWSDSAWLRLRGYGGSESGTLRFDVEANPDSQTREGRILINDAPVRIIQFGSGEIQPYYVTLRPTETVVSRLAGVGALTFFYGLGDVVPAVPEVDWLHVVEVVKQADRREVVFAFDENPEASERVGTIVVGGKRFTVLQQAGEAAPAQVGGDVP